MNKMIEKTLKNKYNKIEVIWKIKEFKMKEKVNISQAIIDKRMRKIEKEKLKELGYNLIEIQASENVYEEIASHVDIFTCKIGNKLIIEPSIYDAIKEKLYYIDSSIEQGQETVEKKYPYDIKYNVCTIGRKALHNFEYTDAKIKQELTKQGFELINTTQGYTNCSIAVIDDNSAIVTDRGLYKILEKHKINVLYLEYEPDIKLLTREGYSNRKGFIGGAISRIGGDVIIFGDLNKIDKDEKIRKFILAKELNIIDFKELDVIDYGGMVLLN